jgi:Protein of unknown function (DUF3572)
LKPSSISASEASTIVLNLIAFIASDEVQLERFSALSGISLFDMKTGAIKPEFQAFVLDYALQDEKLIIDFSILSGTKPEVLQFARFALPGATRDF